jgi:hypothetical protein
LPCFRWRNPNACWSKYKKEHDLLYGVFGTICGLIMAVTDPWTGRHADKEFVTRTHVDALRLNELPALCDSIFIHQPGAIIPIVQKRYFQKFHVSKADNRVASSVRVSVEHTIGSLQRMFPVVFEKANNKILAGTPQITFKAACILYNAYVCYNGSLTSLRFRCRPPRFQDWFGGESLSGEHAKAFCDQA